VAGEEAKSRPVVVGICGGTGSGKTTLTRRVVEALSATGVALLQQDNYYKDQSALSPAERDKLNFDHPDAVEMPLLIEHVRRLRAGEPVSRPSYDFTAHRRAAEMVEVAPYPVLVVEGILIFANEDLRRLMDLKVFVDTPADLRFIWRLKRDTEDRARTVESVVHQYLSTVRPMHLEFVEPSKRFADVLISEGGRNQAAVDLVLQKIRSLAGRVSAD